MRRGEEGAAEEGVTLRTIQSQFVEVGDVIFLREGEQVRLAAALSPPFPFSSAVVLLKLL